MKQRHPRERGLVIILALSLVFIFLGAYSLSYAGDIKLMFPAFDHFESRSAQGKVYLAGPAKEQDGRKEYTEKALREFAKEFSDKGYKINSIELWVEGHAESGGVTKLFISLEGNAGCKLILKPQ